MIYQDLSVISGLTDFPEADLWFLERRFEGVSAEMQFNGDDSADGMIR